MIYISYLLVCRRSVYDTLKTLKVSSLIYNYIYPIKHKLFEKHFYAISKA